MTEKKEGPRHDLKLDRLSERAKQKLIANLVKIQSDGTVEVDLDNSAPVASELLELRAIEGISSIHIDESYFEFNKSVPKLKIVMLVVGKEEMYSHFWQWQRDFRCVQYISFSQNPKAIIHSGQISLAISQSDHLSLWPSLIPVISPCSQSQGRKRFPVGRIVVRKHSPQATFPANFPATVFSTLQGAPGGDLQFFPKHRSQKTIHAPATRVFPVGGLHLTRRRVRVREPLSGDALPPQARLTPTSHPSYLFLPFEPARASFGVLLPPRALRSVFPASSGYFFSTPIPARALESVLLPFRSMTKYEMTSSQVSSVTSPESGGRSEIPNLGGRKDEYLTGEAAMPETTEPGFRKWKIENSMIMSWLINSMNNDIELFQVESTLHDFRQGEQSVTQYYNTLTRYWQQLDLFETHSWKCSDDATTYRKIVKQKRLFKFFLGLNRELDDVRGRIMAESIQQRADGDATEIIKPSWQWQYYRVAFTANRGGMKPWIVDTGASDHMTGDAAILQNYKPSNGHSSVHIADGSKSKIAGTGSIKLTKDLYLDSVLHDLKSGKMIGSAELCSGLYLLHVANSQTKSLKQVAYSLRPAQHTNVPSPVTIQSPMPIQPIAPQLANENLQVYIRRRKRQELEHGSQSTCGQYIDSNSSLPEENIDHPIGNYVTYEGLSPSYRAFATSLDDTQVPNTIQEALKISEWKKAVQDEIDALEKNGTWTITDLPVGKRLWGARSSLIGCQSRLVLATTGHKKCVSKWDLEEEVYMEIPPGFEESMAKNQNLKKYLSEEFEVKDLGNLKYFLGMEVARSRKGIVVSQRKYILDLLKETGMLGCKPIDTPMDSQKKLGIEKESTPVDRGRYQRLVGRLIYLSHTRPDIGFAVSAGKVYSSERQRTVTLKYTQMRIGQETSLTGGPLGYCSFVWGNLVTWRSKKQSVVARSSAEAEYRALAQGICEGIWIKRVLSELGQTSSSPILMMCDNQAAISIAKNPVHHDRTKHVEIDRHFITEKVTSETVKLNYVPTKHQTADILTKALPRPNFEDLTCKLGLYDIYSPA
ncbi:Retrovirus-related Pol polyprotein from transposon RE1 [Vitis vinifera]|uniref:Retrovirus-related Pol polyprotein from transposon RE1 n=1 Tax=Vitis vinifera TaxID=29760 RepID=A0A438EMJ0_VITVI|nr:Retrovirus-related Pol polyprotein from transposon RE1 [Vitis vinifera]